MKLNKPFPARCQCGCLCRVPRAPPFAPASLEPEGPVREGPSSGCGLLGWCSEAFPAPNLGPVSESPASPGPLPHQTQVWAQAEPAGDEAHLASGDLAQPFQARPRAGQMSGSPSFPRPVLVGGWWGPDFQERGELGSHPGYHSPARGARLPSVMRWVPQGLAGAAGSCQSPPP